MNKPNLIEECLVEFETGFPCSRCKKVVKDKCLKITWKDNIVEYVCKKCFKYLQHGNEED